VVVQIELGHRTHEDAKRPIALFGREEGRVQAMDSLDKQHILRPESDRSAHLPLPALKVELRERNTFSGDERFQVRPEKVDIERAQRVEVEISPLPLNQEPPGKEVVVHSQGEGLKTMHQQLNRKAFGESRLP